MWLHALKKASWLLHNIMHSFEYQYSICFSAKIGNMILCSHNLIRDILKSLYDLNIHPSSPTITRSLISLLVFSISHGILAWLIEGNLVKKCVFYLSWFLYVGDEVAGMVVVGAQTPLSLLLVDAVSLPLWQVQEALHGLQVDQQGLWSRARILFLPEDLWQQPLQAHTDINSLKKTQIIAVYSSMCLFRFTWVRLNATRANTAWDTLARLSSFRTFW